MVTFIGIEADKAECDCCGKSNLKKTVALDFDGEIRYYGTTCAGRALGAKTKTVSDVKAAVSRVNEKARIEQRVRYLMLSGQNVVYGRFYINRRSYKSHLTIAAPSELMIKQIFPLA